MVTSALMNVMTQAVLKAAKPLVRDFNEVDRLQVSKKGTANFVTNADIRTERILMEELGHARKRFGFITEESGHLTESEQDEVWIIDPIDGTTNFIHAIPYFCISVAAAKKTADGFDVMAGVIYDPIHDEMFTAEKGMGAKVNNKKLQVSGRDGDLMFSTAAPRITHTNFSEVESSLRRVSASGATVRCSGAAALDLAYVAAGRLDATWYHNLKIWDVAAGMLLVTEAGGKISEIGGGQNMLLTGSTIASNGKIHNALQDMLTGRAV